MRLFFANGLLLRSAMIFSACVFAALTIMVGSCGKEDSPADPSPSRPSDCFEVVFRAIKIGGWTGESDLAWRGFVNDKVMTGNNETSVYISENTPLPIRAGIREPSAALYTVIIRSWVDNQVVGECSGDFAFDDENVIWMTTYPCE